MGFVKLEEMLPKLAARSGDPEALEAAYVVEMVQKELRNIFGEECEGNVRVLSYKKKVLVIGVSSSVWAHEVKMKEGILLSLIATQNIKAKRIIYKNSV